jgi:hypothetical protein
VKIYSEWANSVKETLLFSNWIDTYGMEYSLEELIEEKIEWSSEGQTGAALDRMIAQKKRDALIKIWTEP